MIQKPPIFLFAFANDGYQSLQLEKEEKAILDRLQQLKESGRIDCQSLGKTTLDDLFKELNRFHQRVHILHYGGHSNHEFLMLRDQLARATNLARVIGMQQNLQLVFLNGCGNQEQVEVLFASGVKAIIATSDAIADDKAILFAVQFYDALKGGKTIAEAYQTARDLFVEKFPAMESGISRDVLFRRRGQKVKQEFPWALYLAEGSDGSWSIPDPYEAPVDLDYHAAVPLDNPETNKKLVELTFEGMAAFSNKNQFLWTDYQDESSTETTIYELRQAIYNAFPSLLSVHIQDVFTDDATRKGRLRLKELTDVYLVLSKLLTSIGLANLWQEAVEAENFQLKTDFKLRPAYRADLAKYLQLAQADADGYDALWMLLTLSSIFKENETTFFIAELNGFCEKLTADASLYAAWQFLEYALKRRFLANNIASLEVANLCEEAELHLATLLNRCAFLTSYQLVSVSDISVIKRLRSPQADFVHHKVVLRGVEETIMDRDPLARANFTCNHAVIITKNFHSEEQPLILTPFLVDENAYKIKKREQPKIHFWAGKTADGRAYFQHVEVLDDGFEFPNEVRNTYRVKDLTEVTDLIKYFAEDLGLEA